VILCVVLVGLLRERANPEEAILRKTSGRLAALLNVGLRDHLHCAVFRKYSKQPVAARQMAADLGPEFAGLVPLVQASCRRFPRHPGSSLHRRRTPVHASHHFRRWRRQARLARPDSQAPSESLSGGIYQTGVDRFQVVGFESHDYLAYVISDLDASQNLQLEAAMAPVVREYLAAHATG
jgi:hypothetical protein